MKPEFIHLNKSILNFFNRFRIANFIARVNGPHALIKKVKDESTFECRGSI